MWRKFHLQTRQIGLGTAACKCGEVGSARSLDNISTRVSTFQIILHESNVWVHNGDNNGDMAIF